MDINNTYDIVKECGSQGLYAAAAAWVTGLAGITTIGSVSVGECVVSNVATMVPYQEWLSTDWRSMLPHSLPDLPSVDIPDLPSVDLPDAPW